MYFADFFIYFIDKITILAVLNLQKYEIKIPIIVHRRYRLDNDRM